MRHPAVFVTEGRAVSGRREDGGTVRNGSRPDARNKASGMNRRTAGREEDMFISHHY